MHFHTTKTIDYKTMKPWHACLFGLIFVLIGIVGIAFSVKSINTYNEKKESFIETTANVVSYRYDDDGLAAIIVEYYVNEIPYQSISNSYSNMPKSIGSVVSIRYNPSNPNDMIWENDSTNIVIPIVCSVFTLVGLVIIGTGIKKKIENNR